MDKLISTNMVHSNPVNLRIFYRDTEGLKGLLIRGTKSIYLFIYRY